MDSDRSLVYALVAVALTTLLLLLLHRARTPKQPFLDRKVRHLTLIKRENVSHDTVRFLWGVPRNLRFHLPCGQHVKLFGPNKQGVVAGQWNGKDDKEREQRIERKYTPIFSDSEHVELMLKVYRGGTLERFPDGGKMSQYLDTLQVGQKVEVSGPWGMHEYKGVGHFQHGSRTFQGVKRIGMIAGGTGVTPMLQIASAILGNPQDPTSIHLLFANQTEQDILLRPHLERLQRNFPNQFKLWYTLDRPPAGWHFSSGFINTEMLTEHMPPPAEDTLIFMCGPPPMIDYACKPNLDALGYSKERYFAW